jgi:hypothetical protein
MAKMTRNNLKSLVKECLFEILLESTSGEMAPQINEAKKIRRKRSMSSKPLRPSLDHVAINKKKSAPQVDVSHLTEDPIMAAIFQDTANTTLVEQADAERGKMPKGGGDAASLAVAKSDPSQLFGEASRNWAALAFDD